MFVNCFEKGKKLKKNYNFMLDEISWSSFLNVSGALSDYLSSICGILNYEKLAEHSFLLIGAWRLCVCGGVFVV